MAFLLLVFVLSGLLIIGLAIPMIQRKIKPNPWYGFRTPKTLKHEALWYDANAYAGWLLVQTGILTVAASIFFYPFNFGVDTYGAMVTAIITIGMVYMLVKAFWYIHRYEVE